MLNNLGFVLLFQPLVNSLIFFYGLLGQSLGWAIIGLTLLLRLVLFPLTLPSLKAAQKMQEIKPELDKLKKKHANDKQALAQAQLQLYRKHGANPTAGCLPWIIQIVVLIALFRVFNQVLTADGSVVEQLNQYLYPSLKLATDTSFNTKFFYLDLGKPDLISLPWTINLGIIAFDKLPGVFLLAAAAVQFLSSKLMLPQVKAAQKSAKKTPEKTDDMAVQMQQQMVYLMPLMTIFIGFTFPSGLVLYWLTFSVVLAVQQLLIRSRKERRGGNLINGQ